MNRPETIAAAEEFTRRMDMHPAGQATTVRQFQSTIRHMNDRVLMAIFLNARTDGNQTGAGA